MAERPQNKNLVPYKPGAEWKGNRHGNPGAKWTKFSNLLREAAEKKRLCTKEIHDGLTAGEALAEAAFYHAIMGNPAFAKEIIERLDGKVTDVSESSQRITVEVEYVDGDTDHPTDQASQAPPSTGEGGSGDGPV